MERLTPFAAVVFHGCEQTRGLPSGTAEPHAKEPVMDELSLESGKSVKWISAQLGHRDAAMTLNVYAHALPDEEDDLSFLPGSGDVTGRHRDGTKGSDRHEGVGVSA